MTFISKAGLSFAILGLVAGTLIGQTAAPGQLGTTDLKNVSDQLVSSQKYAEALPYLEELYNRLKDTNTPQSAEVIERVVYYLGLGNTMANNQPDAIRYLEIYLEKFKEKNISRTTGAQDMLAEAYFMSGQFDRASEMYLTLVNSRHTPNDRRRNAKLNLIDSYIRAKSWAKLVSAASAFAADTRDPEVQGRAATALCQAYVETDQPTKVFELIPVLENSSSTARYRTDFNLAMISAGDRMFQAEQFDIALPLYQMAAPRRLIERLITERMEELKAQKEEVTTTRPVPPNIGTLVGSINGEMKRLEEQLEDLKEAESYDEELRTRIAQTLFKQGRRWEALWIYEGLMDDFPESEHGEKAGYAAFALAAELGQRERAIQLGRDYMENFPKGENFETLTWQLTQLMVAAKDYETAKTLADSVLQGKTDHVMADKMLFLIGYSLFQEEEMERAAEFFLRVRKEFPESESREAADFWYAMTFLYRSDYPQALEQFRLFSEVYTKGEFHADAIFRTGVCNYAMEKYDEARKIFEDFLVRYPEAPQVAEANLLLGDIAGNDARLDDALSHYSKVGMLTVNQGHIDYAAMASGRALEALERWDDMISLFTHYLETYGTSGLYAEAIYRIGFAKKQKGDIEGMLASYLDAIKRYGNDPKAIGIDMIARDWPQEYRAHHGEAPDLIVRKELADAITGKEKTAAMRWAMIKEAIDKESGQPAAPAMEVAEADLDSASPAVLVWIGDRALATNNADLARKAYSQVMSRYDQNEWYLPALMALARMNAGEGKTDDAVGCYKQVRELFPQSEEAANALYEQAELFAKQKKYKEAIANLEMILEVKEWRGEAWARALYKIGDLLRAEGNDKEAFAYFQRVYVLYGAYHQWAAKAYMQSANCLAALGKQAERDNTLKEMVSNEALRDQPEYAEAQKALSSN